MRIEVEKHVMVPMRDGIRLSTNVFRQLPHDPAPALLVRMPYNKDALDWLPIGSMPNLFAMVEAGYVVVHQDVRGTSRSEGMFTPMLHEVDDAADTIAWLVSQPWCNGKVGMYGGSYLGMTQLSAACSQPPGLLAIAPAVSTADYYRAPWYSHGGALSLHTSLGWTYMMAMAAAQREHAAGQPDETEISALAAAITDETCVERSPLSAHHLLDERAPWYRTWLEHARYDEFWSELAFTNHFEGITTPALTIGGWFDIYLGSTLDIYTGLRQRAASRVAHAGQRLVIGPWTHLAFSGVYPDRTFGPAAGALAQDLTSMHLAFFDRWLRDREEALEDTKPVRIFVMGIDEWRDEDDWPLPDTKYTDYYLSSSGRANTAGGDGALSTSPAHDDRADVFLYDPRRPVPTLGGNVMRPSETRQAGPVDQRSVEAREDVLCYTTGPLERPVEVTGRIHLVLYVSSSAVDTDFTGKLVDVFPDGRAINLTEGILRVRYRESLTDPQPIDPGEIYEIHLDLWATSNVFLPGHSIRLEVSSSNFPRFDRNTNSGNAIALDREQDIVIAVNRIHHGTTHPTRLVLPIIERS